MADLTIRSILTDDCTAMAAAFRAIGWRSKPQSLFERYCVEQASGSRAVFVAFARQAFAGYVTLLWRPTYRPLADIGAPEVQDLNVLPAYRRRGIAAQLMRCVENAAAERAKAIGLGVGLHPGYNAAQRLYGLLGYVPDGHGVTVNELPVHEGQTVTLDDDTVLHLEKWLMKREEG